MATSYPEPEPIPEEPEYTQPGVGEPLASEPTFVGQSPFSEPFSEPTIEPSGTEPPPYTPPPSQSGPADVPPGSVPPSYAPQPPLSPSDERTWAMLAHLSILVNLFTGFLGPVAAIVIYILFKDRSRYVGFHAMQSFVFQLVFWIGSGILAGVLWTASGILSAILIGLCCMPFALLASLLPLGALIYGVVGAIQTYQGQKFEYWLVADWVRGA